MRPTIYSLARIQTATALAVAVTALFATAGTARASLMAYEGFGYTAGDSLTNASAQGSGGSFGWGGRWTGANNGFATNTAGSLVYVDPFGNTLATNGGSVMIGTTNSFQPNAQPSRSFNFGTLSGTSYSGLSGGTYWSSFIMKWIGPTNATSPKFPRKGDLVFRSGAATNANSTGTALYSVGSPNSSARTGTPNDTWTTWTGNDAPPLNTGLTATADKPLDVLTFVLIRVDLSGNGTFDNVYTWFNWTNLNVEPTIDTANLTNNSANEDGLNNIRLDANGSSGVLINTCLAFDEFRFGNSYADVTPHSSGGGSQAPTVTANPQNATATETYPASFSVTAVGDPPLFYQWYYNTNILLTDATNASFTIGAVQLGDAGTYHCVISNNGGSVASQTALLTVLPAVPAGISSQPQPNTNAIGFLATFSVTATGSAPLGYQWYLGATPLTDRTNAILSFFINSTNDAGNYSVVVSNKFGTITSTSAVLVVSSFGASQLPAFPGADGGGKLAKGGRGGAVYHVTKLNSALDDPQRNTPGTLVYGLSGNTARTIVFDVAGVFHLGKNDTTNWTSGGNAWDSTSRQGMGGNLTISGQTAPGPVIIMGGSLKPGGNNIVIRNVTIAAGYGMRAFWEPDDAPPGPGKIPTSFTMDAMDISGQNIMIDHVDAFYGTDEAISCNEFAENLTIQYCNNALSQNFDEHGFGHLLQADTDHKVSFIHNLDAHIRSRLPRIGSEVGTGAQNDFRNNVTYNWSGGAGYSGAQQLSKNNFINNFYLVGPGGDKFTNQVEAGGVDIFAGSSGYTYAYVSGNLWDSNHDGDLNETAAADANFVSIISQSSAYNVDIGVTMDARQSFTNVLRYVGSRWWERDYDVTVGNTNAVNTLGERVLRDVITGTGRLQSWADDPHNTSGTYQVDPVNEGAEWRALWALRMDTNGAAPFNRSASWDTDGDGMPDSWELEHGLNPNAADNNGDFDNDFYTNLEEYMNEIAAWPAPGTIIFTGDKDNRYASIFNWRVNGTPVNISSLGTVTTFSVWQPSKYDTTVISNTTVLVDSVGQHAGTLRLAPAGVNTATLNITNGWLKVENTLEIAKAGTGTVNLSGGKLRVGTLTNGGGTASFNFTGGTLAADKVTFNLVNQGGILSPGDSPGLTQVTGDLTQDGTSTLAIEINGTNASEFDRVIVDGTANLNGALVVTFTNGYVPPPGAIFTILTCASRNGTFSSFSYPSNDTTLQLVYSATQVRLVVAGAVNTAPTFSGAADQTVNVGVTVVTTNTAVDVDEPAQSLLYSLLSGPSASVLNTNTGVFTWRPNVIDSGTTNLITVSVVDNGVPPLGATQNFSVIVNPLTPATASSMSWAGGQFSFTLNGQIGPDYAVETSTNLTNWTTLVITNSPALPVSITDPAAAASPVRFYRIKAGPPLP